VVRDALALAPRSRTGSVHSLRETITAAQNNCRQKLQQHGVQLRVRMVQPDVCVRAEPDGLQRVLVNLLCNAAEAARPGGQITLRVATDREGGVEIRVSDDGSGLSEEALERLFDPFFTTKQHGTGLGLTIAHRLVESYGGSITAHNRAAGGAEFRIVLPAAPPDSEQTSDPARQTTAA
jgi:signal transduction histidine kinase